MSYNYTFYLPFEDDFDPVAPTKWMQENWTKSILYSALYVFLCFGGQHLMRNRPAYDLKRPLIIWNICLALFSCMGMVRFAPDFFYVLWFYGFKFSICVCSYAHGVTAYWTQAFAMSKVVELGDTAFIVLRKRPLMFLHWYHHVTVLIYTWHAFKDHTAAGRWFIFMNYTVHTLMYTYYALRAMGYRIPKVAAMALTIAQLSQMVVGVVVNINTFRHKFINQSECRQTDENLLLAIAMYASYFLLFAHFFYKAYFVSARYDKKPHAPPTKDQVANGVHPLEPKSQSETSDTNSTANGYAKHAVDHLENYMAMGDQPMSKQHQNGALKKRNIK